MNLSKSLSLSLSLSRMCVCDYVYVVFTPLCYVTCLVMLVHFLCSTYSFNSLESDSSLVFFVLFFVFSTLYFHGSSPFIVLLFCFFLFRISRRSSRSRWCIVVVVFAVYDRQCT